jgi:EAL domain-containing protein (putative c-di-GMP-specific phosphodiesterase class I)/GGDEF domain-containing protein
MLSFRNRLLILLIGLVVGAETVTLFTALARTSATVRDRAEEQLVAGVHIAQRLLEYRERQLATAVTVLTADFGLREAVASGDRPTVASALANHATRIGADLTVAMDLDGQVIARGEAPGAVDPTLLAALNASAGDESGEARFVVTPSGAWQVFVSPVLAPDEIGRIALGFAIDEALARELRDLVGVDVAFLKGPTGGQAVSASTVTPLRKPGFRVQAALRSSPASISIDGEEYLATATHLESDQTPLDVALFKPMREVMAPYRELALNLGLIIGVTLAAAVAAGIYLGRSAARPVQQLAAGAARIAAGDYSQGVAGSGGQELENLADAFNSMQRGIADRESRLMHMVRHDPATGLANRLHAEEWLERHMPELSGDQRLCVVLVAVGNLQQVSATLGFDIASELVDHLVRGLSGWQGENGLVARLDSVHFLVAATNLAAGDVDALVEQIGERCRNPLFTAGIALRTSAVLGAAVAPLHGNTAVELLRCAEAAVETATQRKLAHAFFERSSDEEQRRRLRLGAELPLAVSSGQLYLQYQPKVRLGDRLVSGLEALVRWRHPELGIISPAEFIPIAERTGASGVLTRWVLRTSLEQLAQWNARGIHVEMAVNFSAADILDPGMLQHVLEVLRDTQVPAGSLTVEITESVLLHEPEAARRNMELLRVAGVRFSIDDFGTGYSSLSQLRDLAADELKIDQSFVRQLSAAPENQAVIRAVVDLAHGLGLRTVAEGVETEAQWQQLVQLGCDYVQGYLTGRPQSAADLDPLLRASCRTESGQVAGPAPPRVLELRRSGESGS